MRNVYKSQFLRPYGEAMFYESRKLMENLFMEPYILLVVHTSKQKQWGKEKQNLVLLNLGKPLVFST